MSPYFKEIGDICNKDTIALSLFYLAENEKEKINGQENFFDPYFNYLPKSMSEQPIFYSDEKKQLLMGSYLLDKIKLWEKQLEQEYNYLLNKGISATLNIKNFNFESYKFSRTIVWSRNYSLTYNGQSHSSLVPIADLCNFNPNKLNTNWSFNENENNFILRSSQPIKKDEEVITFFILSLDFFAIWRRR